MSKDSKEVRQLRDETIPRTRKKGWSPMADMELPHTKNSKKAKCDTRVHWMERQI